MRWSTRGEASLPLGCILLRILQLVVLAQAGGKFWQSEQAEFIVTRNNAGLDIIRGKWDTGETENILTDFTASTGGALGIAVDLKEDGSPREMLIGSRDNNIYTCPMDANAVADCTIVGVCTAAVPRCVEYDKDANGQIIGYWAACSDLRYCDLTGPQNCISWWTNSNNDNFAFKLELAADGTTQAVYISKWTSVWRFTYPGKADTRVLGTAFAGSAADRLRYPRFLDYNVDETGTILSFIVSDTNNDRVQFCTNGVDNCETILDSVKPNGVMVRKNTDGQTRSMWVVDSQAAGGGGGLYRCELGTLACELMGMDNIYDIAIFGPIPTSTTTSSTTTSTTLTTVTNTGSTSTVSSTSSTLTSSTTTSTTSTSSSTSTLTRTSSTSTTETKTSSTSTSSTLTMTSSTSTTMTMTSSTSTTATRTSSTTTSSTQTETSSTSTSSTMSSTTTSSTTSTSSATAALSPSTTDTATVTWTSTSLSTTVGSMPSTTTDSSVWTTITAMGSTTTLPAGPTDSTSFQLSSNPTSVATTTGTTTTTSTVIATVITTFSSYCYNDRTFSDTNGLLCSDWAGWNCSTPSESYTEAELTEIQAACPISCSLCPKGSLEVTGATPQTSIAAASLVSVSHAFNIDFDGVNASDQEQGFLKSYSELLQVPVGNLQLLITSGAGDGRRLAGETVVRCAVVVSDASKLLSIVSAATSLASDSATISSFGNSLSSETGVDTSSLSAIVESPAQVASISAALDADGNLVGSVSPTGSSGSAVLTLESGCVDEVFLDEQGRPCSDWLGYSCTDPRWLSSNKPYTLEGLLEVQQNCLLSCGFCAPANRPSQNDLQATCKDDENSTDFCRRWQGIDCNAAASDFAFPETYAKALLTLCPFSCGTCDSEAVAPCSDAAGYTDELGYTCADWAGLSCTSLYTGYSELGVLHVQAYCQESCGFCAATFGTSREDLEVDVCEDDSDFLIAGTFGCDFFTGKSCTYTDIFLDSRWLLGPAAVAEWHQALWRSCPVSCGICQPQDRSTESDLFTECQDDGYVGAWCEANWEGTDCLEWESVTQLGSASSTTLFNATLFGRCPKSCGLCEAPVCQAGTYRDTAQHTCEECEVGSYASVARAGAEASACTLARTGYYINATGSTQEFYCDFGTFTASPGSTRCSDCPAGNFAGSRGSSDCEACAAGFYASEAGMSACERCPLGYYQDSDGKSFCQACPKTFTTMELGSLSSEACVCGAGTYFESSSGLCQSCPRGFSCPGGANSVDEVTGLDSTVVLAPGMMSLESDPFSAYSCITNEVACPGYRRPVWDATSNPSPVCQDNSFGVRCGFCADGYYLDEEEGCLECTVDAGTVLGVLHISGVVIILIACLYRAYVLVSRDDFPPKVIFWLAITFIQFIIEIEGLPVRWPTIIIDVFRLCNYFDIFKFYDNFMALQEECLFGSSATSRMIRDVVKPLLPAALFLPLAVLFRITARRNLNVYFVIATIADSLLAVFVQVAVMVFYVFPTEEMPNGLLFLTYYPRIQHGSDDWVALLPCTAVAALFYVAGFLSFVFYGLWNLPRLYARRTEDAEMFAFFGDYRPSMYWWTGVVLLYEVFFALANAVVINPYVRVYLTMVFVICFAVMEIAWMPGLTKETQTASVAVELGVASLLAVGTSWSWQEEDVDMEDYQKVVAVMIFTLIISLTVIVACRLAVAFYQGRTSEDGNRTEILSNTLIWMRSGLSMPLAEQLRCISDMDYSDNEILRKWTLSLRTNGLRVAPKKKKSAMGTFASHVMSGHLLSYVAPSAAMTELTSTHDRRKRALEILQQWSTEKRGRPDEFDALPVVSVEEAARVPALFPCKESVAHFHARTPDGSPEGSERSRMSDSSATSRVEAV